MGGEGGLDGVRGMVHRLVHGNIALFRRRMLVSCLKSNRLSVPLSEWHIDGNDCLVLSTPDGLTGVYQLLSTFALIRGWFFPSTQCLPHCFDRMGSGEPELEGERALMDQHGEAVVSAAAFVMGEL